MNILIIAREDALRDGLQTVLAGILPGAEINLLDTGELAENQIKQKKYAYVFLYPGLIFETQLSTLQRIKTISNPPRTIMIVEEPYQIQLAVQAGADQVLLKGFTTARLITMIHETQGENLLQK